MIELRLPVRVVDRSRLDEVGGPWQLRDATFRWLCGGGRYDMEAIAATVNDSAALRARAEDAEEEARALQVEADALPRSPGYAGACSPEAARLYSASLRMRGLLDGEGSR